MAVVNEDLRALFIQTPVGNGWHHHGSLNAVEGGFETCVHIYHANSLLGEISQYAFFQKAILPEGRTFIMVDQSRRVDTLPLSFLFCSWHRQN